MRETAKPTVPLSEKERALQILFDLASAPPRSRSAERIRVLVADLFEGIKAARDKNRGWEQIASRLKDCGKYKIGAKSLRKYYTELQTEAEAREAEHA